MREARPPARSPRSGLKAQTATRWWPLGLAAVVFLAAVVTGWKTSFPVNLDTSQIVQVPFIGTALHNLRVVLLIVLGGLLLGLPSMVIVFWNGIQAGMLLKALEPRLWPSLAAHGVPELAGQFVAAIASLELGRSLFCRVVHEEQLDWRPILGLSLLAVFLTVLAAGIESRLTPIIATGVQ